MDEQIDDIADKEIKKMFDNLLNDLEGGTLFGKPIDTTNILHMTVAAYCLGMYPFTKNLETPA